MALLRRVLSHHCVSCLWFRRCKYHVHQYAGWLDYVAMIVSYAYGAKLVQYVFDQYPCKTFRKDSLEIKDFRAAVHCSQKLGFQPTVFKMQTT